MPRVAANLVWLFTEVPFMDRFAAARRAGFKYVEFLLPYEHPGEQIKEALDTNDQQAVLFLSPSGDWASGERGIAASPTRVAEFRSGIKTAISYARILGVSRVGCLAGKITPGCSRKEQRSTLIENLRFAADAMGEYGIKVLVEHVSLAAIPGFFLNRVHEVLDVIADAGRSNLYLHYDMYHAQRTEGNLTQILRDHIARIDHIHIADTPGRHQPGTGEINYPFLFAEMDTLGYKEFVGLEYEPIPDTVKSLGWIKEYGCQLA